MSMKPELKNINDYLISDSIINWKEPAITNTADELTVNEKGEVNKARLLYEWVRDSIPHSNDIGSDIVTCIASDVLKYRTGICFAKSHLLAALLRAINIPAGFCYQVLRRSDNNRLGLHGLNAVYLATLGKWIRIDSRGNTDGIDAQFSIDKEQLAFPIEEWAGEFIYEGIFAKPENSVIDKLLRYKTRTELWNDLPGPF